MTNELKNCPFCGGDEAGTKWHHGFWSVQCGYWADEFSGHCGQDWGEFDTQEAAIAAWNNRAPGWIDCEERLPEKEGLYLVAIPIEGGAPGVLTGIFHKGAWRDRKAIYWQPLPEPPG